MSLQNQISNILRGMELLEKYSTNGDMQPHEAYALIKQSGIEESLSEVLSRIKDVAVENLKNNFIEDKKSYKDANFQYTVRAGSTRYYFTDVPEVNEKKKVAESSKEWLDFKAAEQKYKTAFIMRQKGQMMVDEETGEVIDPSTVKVVYSSDSLSIKPI